MRNNIFLFFLYLFKTGYSMALLKKSSMGIDSFDNDLIQILNSKDYLPDEDDLVKPSVMKSIDNDATYILSKLSDDVLLKLLNQQPKKTEYNLNDILSIVGNVKESNTVHTNFKQNEREPQGPVFRLENKEVQPYNYNVNEDPKYNAFQKLNNILYSRPLDQNNSDDDDKHKEILFNVLVAQLKSLCCSKHKPKPNINSKQLKHLTQKNASQKGLAELLPKSQLLDKTKEQLFLIINDEIKSNVTEDLIAVDPDTLSKNSSVLLLGPITTPLTDAQLKLVMNRIGNELSKPEYLPLLQKISVGALDDERIDNLGIKKNLLTGPESRRYMKAHRCNHQSKLARVYGGVKWIICTGYLNLNTPSLYD